MDVIVVGIDGSKGAQVATRWAAKQALQTGGRVIAVHAMGRSGLWMLDAAQIDTDELLTELRGYLDGPWVAPLRTVGVAYTTKVVRGDPATELLRIARRADASMLVLGSKSHGAIADLVVGGTVHKIINRSDIPVVLVPASPPAKPPAKRKPPPRTTRAGGGRSA